jgi:hypothetical protein
VETSVENILKDYGLELNGDAKLPKERPVPLEGWDLAGKVKLIATPEVEVELPKEEWKVI